MANEVKNVPELRFPEFRNEWEDIKFENIFQEVSNKTGDLVKNPLFSLTVENGITPKSDRYKRDFLVKKNDNFKIVEPNNIVYNPMNVTLGAIDLSNYNYNLAVSGYYHVLKIINNFNVSFVANFLKTNRMITHYKKIATGTLIEKQRVHFSEFKNIIKKFPSIKEQQKIGDFFSKLDRQIELEEQKLAKLEEQKKGYMQKIFSQELRFKDENGNDYPEWKKKKLDDVANYRRGSFPQPYGNKEWYDEKNGEPFVQVVDVDKNMKLHDKTKQKISDLAKPKSVKGFKGDIVVTLQGSIGRVALLHYDAYIDRTLLLIDSFKIEMNKNYFKYVLYLLFLKEKERAPGGTIKTITKKVLSNFKIDIPNVGEQEKIGKFFEKYDECIQKQSNKIELLKKRKKSFLQKMFV